MLVLVRMKSAFVASLALLACAAFAQAHELKGRAIAVSDGDSITVMDVRNADNPGSSIQCTGMSLGKDIAASALCAFSRCRSNELPSACPSLEKRR